MTTSQKNLKDGSEYFDLKMSVTDHGDPPRTISGTTRVKVHKILPAMRFNQSLFETEVAEDAKIGDVVYTLSDLGGPTGGAANMTYEVIDKWTTVFKAEDNDLKLLKKLDYETDQFHLVKIR